MHGRKNLAGAGAGAPQTNGRGWFPLEIPCSLVAFLCSCVRWTSFFSTIFLGQVLIARVYSWTSFSLTRSLIQKLARFWTRFLVKEKLVNLRGTHKQVVCRLCGAWILHPNNLNIWFEYFYMAFHNLQNSVNSSPKMQEMAFPRPRTQAKIQTCLVKNTRYKYKQLGSTIYEIYPMFF